MIKTITYADALASLQALVAERGEDYVYALDQRIERVAQMTPTHTGATSDIQNYIYAFSNVSCMYLEYDGEFDYTAVDDGLADPVGPSCGVGYVFYNLLPDSIPIMREAEGSGAADLIETLRYGGVANISDAAALLLSEFQDRQDSGYPYGRGLASAIDAVTGHFGRDPE